jgi:glycerol-3-phosphate dehydrogenase
VNRVLDVDLTRADIVGTYAGLRPLIAPSHGSTITASREHRVVVEENGLVRVSGGKYTTYRQMAEETVDAAVGVLGEQPSERPSGTVARRLVGAADRPELDGLGSALTSAWDLPPGVAARLVARHGTEAKDVLELGRACDLLGVIPGSELLEAEVLWAVRTELALSLDDVLARRLRLVQELADRGAAIAPRLAAIVGEDLGWDAARRDAEVSRYLDGARREFAVA